MGIVFFPNWENTPDLLTVCRSGKGTKSAEGSIPSTGKPIVLKQGRMDFGNSPQSWDPAGGHGKMFGFCNGK